MLTMQIKVPRRTIVAMGGERRRECDLACVTVQLHEDEPEEIAVVMFSRMQDARRFIAANDLRGWKPAFVAYPELRGLLLACMQKQAAARVVVDFCNDDRQQLVKSFRIEDAVAAIDAADLETGEPILIEGHCFTI